MKIRNINEKYGAPVTFSGDRISDCLTKMAASIIGCGSEISGSLGEANDKVFELSYRLSEGKDFEIVKDEIITDEKKLKEIDHDCCPECGERRLFWNDICTCDEVLHQRVECLACGILLTVFYKASSYRID